MHFTLTLRLLLAGAVLASAVWLLTAARARSPQRPAGFEIRVSANTQGILEPCGCAVDQSGGLARRASVLRAAARISPGVVIDGGNLVARLAPNPQVLSEALSIMKELGYRQLRSVPRSWG